LAQLSEKRASLAPDLPTLMDAGVDLALPPNIGLWAPAETPDDVVAALADAVAKAAGGETFQNFAKNALVEIDYAGPADFGAVLKKEDAFFAELLPTIDFSQQ
ncbi:MAG: tripartite tricarboxylate transporter substrate-binding protein, partial [Nitratireductor sp.]